MKQQYSRLARVEEKKNIRSAIIFGGLTVLFILFLIFFGLPLVARFASFVSDSKRGKNSSTNSNQGLPIYAPNIITPVEFTNQSGIVIKGSAQPNSVVSIFVNDNEQKTTADSDGNFSINTSLQKGQNQIYAKAKNSAGVVSDKSQTYTVTFDNEPPKLDISSPSDGANFYGEGQKKITIQRHTESDIDLTINGHVVIVESDGAFKFEVSLSNGANQITISAIDKAGNKKETSLTVNYSP